MKLIFIILCLATLPAWAQSNTADLDDQDLEIYKITFNYCHYTTVRENIRKLPGRAKFENQPIYYGTKEALMGRWLKWNTHLEILLKSPGFKLALDHCMGPDKRTDGSSNRLAQLNKHILVSDLMISDILGKVVAGVAIYRFSKLIGVGLTFLKGLGTAGPYIYWTTNIGLHAWMGYGFYEVYRHQEDVKEKAMEDQDPFLKAAMDDYRFGKIKKDQIGDQYAEYVKAQFKQQTAQLFQINLEAAKNDLVQTESQFLKATREQERSGLQLRIDHLKREIAEIEFLARR